MGASFQTVAKHSQIISSSALLLQNTPQLLACISFFFSSFTLHLLFTFSPSSIHVLFIVSPPLSIFSPSSLHLPSIFPPSSLHLLSIFPPSSLHLLFIFSLSSLHFLLIFIVIANMSKIVVCFDGTGNSYQGNTSDTNIVKLYEKLDRTSKTQFHYYQRKSILSSASSLVT